MTSTSTNPRILCDGPWFGAAWCVHEPPRLAANARDIHLLPIDAPVGGVQAGQCALVNEPASLRSTGSLVLAWAIS